MNLDCLNGIITEGLAIHIDISDVNSWNLNTGFTSISLTQWSGAKSDNINLYDFGLTAYDNGSVESMYSGATLTPQDLKVVLNRIGYNTGQTAYSGETQYDLYPISAITSASTVGNYFELDGGYLQGFFKLKDYNFEQFPARYDNGITIEILLRIDSGSSGMFFFMGARAEDKYNPEFSGESQTVVSQTVVDVPTYVVGHSNNTIVNTTGFTGVQTSDLNYLNAFVDKEQVKSAFSSWENMMETIPEMASQSANTKSNVIAFSLTPDKKLAYHYIDDKNLIRTQTSPKQITKTGWTIIDMVFTPDTPIENYDPTIPECYPRRKGILNFYVNGRQFWNLPDFDEFYFRGFANDKEKQLGVPYSISFGGGSFGLKHSWHYDFRNLPIYSGQDQTYIENNIIVTTNFLDDNPCFTGDTGGSYNSLGLILTANTTTFSEPNDCDSGTTAITVLEIQSTGVTGTTLYEYLIEFNEPIDVISNRDIILTADIFDTGIFKQIDENFNAVYNTINLVAVGNDPITITQEITYGTPNPINNQKQNGSFSTFDGQTYEYVDGATGLLIDGTTGYPVLNNYNQTLLDSGVSYENNYVTINEINTWNTIKTTFRIKDNTANQTVKVGLLIKSTAPLNDDFLVYIKNFRYLAADNLSQDGRKENLLIEQNFNSSYIGGIQKLRIYDFAFNSQQVLHNAKIELKNNPNYNFIVSTGGRIIYT